MRTNPVYFSAVEKVTLIGSSHMILNLAFPCFHIKKKNLSTLTIDLKIKVFVIIPCLLKILIAYWLQIVLSMYFSMWGRLLEHGWCTRSHILKENWFSSPRRQTAHSASVVDGRSWVPFLFMLECWLACSCGGTHSCCELLSAVVLLRPEGWFCSSPSWPLLALTGLSIPFSMMVSAPRGGVWYRSLIPGWALHGYS